MTKKPFSSTKTRQDLYVNILTIGHKIWEWVNVPIGYHGVTQFLKLAVGFKYL